MRFIQIGPKYLYYLGVILPTALLCFFAWLSGKYALAQQFEGFIITTIFSFFLLWRILYCLKKYVYAKADTVAKVLVLGNILFENEIPLDNVELQGSTWLSHTVLKIKVLGKIYFINTLGGNIEDQFESVLNNSK